MGARAARDGSPPVARTAARASARRAGVVGVTAALSLGLALSCGGCIDYYLVGAVPHEGVPAGAWSYQIGRCARAADKVPVQGPTGASYFVATGEAGLVLYEIAAGTRSGSEIRNRWSDAEADHFFAYERDRTGYHYVLPADRSRTGRRYTLSPGSYRVIESEGSMRPEGQPDTVCVLQPTL